MTPLEFKKLRLQNCYEFKADLARVLDCTKQTIWNYENGERKIPDKVADIMNKLTSRL